MPEELKKDIEMLAKLTFELSQKHGMRISASCVSTDGEYPHSWVTFGQELKECTYWPGTNKFTFDGGINK